MNERSTGTVEFRDRDTCLNCSSSSLTPVWTARFSDDDVQRNLGHGGYSVGVAELLGDNEFQLVRCDTCDLMFHRRVLSPEWLDVLYSDWIDRNQIEHFHAGVGPRTHMHDFEQGRQCVKHALRFDTILRARLPSVERYNLLDFGCGDGEFAALLGQLGFRSYGIDVGAARAERSGERGVTIFRSLGEFRQADIGELHVITLFQNLEHLDDPRRVLDDLVDCLTPGGLVVVEVPDCSGITGRPGTLLDFHKVHPLEHINNFTPGTLTAFCEGSGLTRITRIPAHVTTSIRDLVRTEATRVVKPQVTNQYFLKS
ncbi:MAG: class I SAM-dependent methyltransferase [Acidimicrobiia bacterium]|nr:class I SAM-dependent methyltransferase [Acidimicrobiia bacterium]